LTKTCSALALGGVPTASPSDPLPQGVGRYAKVGSNLLQVLPALVIESDRFGFELGGIGRVGWGYVDTLSS
jgi:hypothetical protein